MSHIRAFTLIELLIVIAIIAILGSATVMVLNPVEMMKQSRDGTRIQDIENIDKGLKMALFDNPTLLDSLSASNIYVSRPSSSCPSGAPAGFTYVCNASTANLNKTDGTGWIPLALSSVPALPIDPANSSSSYYIFMADPIDKDFTISSPMESQKQIATASVRDGGTDLGRFEKGDPALWTDATELIGRWNFDSGSGAITNGQTAGLQDSSGRSNNGVAYNANGTGMSFVPGKFGSAVQLDGIDDYVRLPNSLSFINAHGPISISLWANASATTSVIRRMFSDNCNEIGIHQSASNKIGGEVYNNIDSTQDMTPGSWFHIVVEQDQPKGLPGTVIKLYINGSYISQTTKTISTDNGINDPPFGIGFDPCYSEAKFAGIIDDVRVYNHALSDGDVQAIYLGTK